MKKTIALALLGGVSSLACAQNNVQLYGLLDVGVNHITGLRAGSVTLLSSGIMQGSRVGFRGNEDLGGGMRAIFTVESRLETDTGGISNRTPSGTQLPDRLAVAGLLGLPAALQPVVDSVGTTLGNQIGVNLAGNFWDRQVYVGLVTPVGAVLAGRQYTPAYEVSSNFDVMGTQSSLAAGQVASFPSSIDFRASNSVTYRIEKGGVVASLMYGLGEGQTTTGRVIGGMGMYKGSAFSVGAGYNARKNEVGQGSLRSLVIGGSVNLGPGALYALYSGVKDEHPTGLSGLRALLTPTVGAATAGVVQNAYIQGLRQDARLYHAGYKLTSGVHTVYVAYTMWNDRRPANADVASYGAVYSYALSKRTDVSLVLTHFENKNLAQAAPGQGGFLGGVTASAGTDSNNVALGLRHSF